MTQNQYAMEHLGMTVPLQEVMDAFHFTQCDSLGKLIVLRGAPDGVAYSYQTGIYCKMYNVVYTKIPVDLFQIRFYPTGNFIVIDKYPGWTPSFPRFEPGTRIHLNTRNGMYTVHKQIGTSLFITCNKWKEDTLGPVLREVSAFDVKCIAGGININSSQHWKASDEYQYPPVADVQDDLPY